MAGYARVIEILDNAIGGPGAQIGVHGAFWRGLARDQFINKSVFGLKLIELGDSAKSNLIKALKGEAPFDGSSFRRMPARRPPVPAEQIAEIAAWIDAGAPEHAAPGPAPAIAAAGQAGAAPGSPAASTASAATIRSFARRDAVNTGAAARAAVAGVDMKTVHRVYRIHPAIGIARMGDSTAAGEEGYFIGPEVPNFDFVPGPYDASGTGRGNYRDRSNKIRREGARFRIYEYAYSEINRSEPIMVREITSRDAEIVWEVEIGNRKSFTENNTKVPNLPGPVEHDGTTGQVDIVGSIFGDQVKLATLLRDAEGRLIVLGGAGRSRSPSGARLSGLFNKDWYDDAGDGPVRARIKMRDSGRRPEVDSAWVITSVPAYAAPVRNIVTLWDLAYSRAVEKFGDPFPVAVSFRRHIYPVLRGAANMQWVTRAAARGALGHRIGRGGDFLEPGLLSRLANKDTVTSPGLHEAARMAVYRKLRRPNSPLVNNLLPAVSGNMPDLNGDFGSDLAVTPVQYMMMYLWARGDFSPDFDTTSDPQRLEDVAIADQPRTLNEGALVTTAGGSFQPGIEACVVMLSHDVFERPFRINRNCSAGTLTASLSVPWQADFEACTERWWPGARPTDVTADGSNFYKWLPESATDDETVNKWRELGFLRRFDSGGREVYYERERLLHPPSVFTGV
jgi:hypothetical protein